MVMLMTLQDCHDKITQTIEDYLRQFDDCIIYRDYDDYIKLIYEGYNKIFLHLHLDENKIHEVREVLGIKNIRSNVSITYENATCETALLIVRKFFILAFEDFWQLFPKRVLFKLEKLGLSFLEILHIDSFVYTWIGRIFPVNLVYVRYKKFLGDFVMNYVRLGRIRELLAASVAIHYAYAAAEKIDDIERIEIHNHFHDSIKPHFAEAFPVFLKALEYDGLKKILMENMRLLYDEFDAVYYSVIMNDPDAIVMYFLL